jgi:hypothetical protein
MIRWNLLARPETDASHQRLTDLIDGNLPLLADTLAELDAPGLVAGMRIIESARIKLFAPEAALIIKARFPQWEGEEEICRYVIIFKDRSHQNGGSLSWFRESLQFGASASVFDSLEPLAIASMKTFKRTHPVNSSAQSGKLPAAAAT